MWSPPDETGGEITGYDLRFMGAVSHTETVINSWYDPPNDIKTSTGSVTVQVFNSYESLYQRTTDQLVHSFLLSGPS